MELKIWDCENQLFMYGNEEKLNDLLSRAFESVVTGYQKSKKTEFNFATTVRNLFAVPQISNLGFDVSGAFSFERAKTEVSAITFDKKFHMLLAYCQNHEELPYINAHDGKILFRNCKKSISEWESRLITDGDKKECIGQVACIFKLENTGRNFERGTLAEQLFYPMREQLYEEFFSEKKSLWLIKSTHRSKHEVEIPILLSNLRLVSQYAMSSLANFPEHKIEATGLLFWEGNKIICDPIALRLFRHS